MPSYKFCYFNARAYGEVCRWIFVAADQEYEDFRWERDDWLKHKSGSPTGQAPWLEVDGEKIGQSTAISRYLAKQFGLAGKTDMEQAKVDTVVACEVDFSGIFHPLFFEKDEERKVALIKKMREETFPASLERFENLLKANNGGDGFFVGDQITWCDMQVANGLNMLSNFELDDLVDNYPKLKAHKARVEGHPKIAAWIAKRPQTQY